MELLLLKSFTYGQRQFVFGSSLSKLLVKNAVIEVSDLLFSEWPR